MNQQRLPSLTIPAPAASPYSPAAITAALSAQNNNTARTVYVGNLPATASVDELLNLVHFGPLESIRVLPRSRVSSCRSLTAQPRPRSTPTRS